MVTKGCYECAYKSVMTKAAYVGSWNGYKKKRALLHVQPVPAPSGDKLFMLQYFFFFVVREHARTPHATSLLQTLRCPY